MTRRYAGEVARGGGAGASDHVALDYRDRFLRRKRLVTAGGDLLFVDLPETVSLDDGDGLILADGGRIAVVAAPEPLVAVSAPDGPGLARLAWHVGNRHTPAEIDGDRLLVQRDHVIEDMLQRLGATLTPLLAPFRPEGGAYGHGRTHGHHAGGATDDPDGHR